MSSNKITLRYKYSDFTYVEDTADALINLSLSKFQNAEVFNICNGRTVKVYELVKIISQILNKKPIMKIENKRKDQ